ncbi:hypothetical protein DLM75_21465 [Leptospira stimsonii]|uniref:Uncharacterized protein n=1 Tax=Leptospira stimsonii TaxID=2202203 RepID=A0A396YVS4_9LEPT|nr:hypothetical protein DLM75_21465 [Leptospira stimsonii]
MVKSRNGGVPAFVFSKNQFIGVPTFCFQRIPMESFEVPFSRRVRNVLLLKIQIDWWKAEMGSSRICFQ